jgi:hypothetical protein
MKKEIFDKYAVAIAKQFHLTLDQMFDKTKRRDIVDLWRNNGTLALILP